jgi:uncharacterized protein YrrD
MRKGKDARGLLVITKDSGKKVGKVEDLILDRQGSRVLGILVDEAGWFKEAKVVPWPSFRVTGLDAVIIDDEASAKKASEVPDRWTRAGQDRGLLFRSRVRHRKGL